MDSFVDKLIAITPSPRQIAWQKLEFTGFLHFGINTFTDKEWGDGTESPQLYNPTNLDTDQWCRALKSAGITACIITAKHHDGFCLFDTAYTQHSVMASPQPVDVVASLSASCAKYGLKLGVYLSPWDRNHPKYGSGTDYDDYFCAQLEELTTKYGQLYCLWFDGACGEGPNGKTQAYDWPRYYGVIRKNQPHAAISVCGPDVRWIGNEAGDTRHSEWSVVHSSMKDAETTANLSQQSDDEAFRAQRISSQEEDLGSRERLAQELAKGGELCWYPAEVDVSIRPGWFYHPSEDNQVRSVDNLLDIYEKSVGGNAVLLLNIPPDTKGQINAADADRLAELDERIKSIYNHNIFDGAKISDFSSITLDEPKTLTHIVLCEDITHSQRIESFEILAEINKKMEIIYKGTTVGYKKICRFKPTKSDKWRINITQSRGTPMLRCIEGHYDNNL